MEGNFCKNNQREQTHKTKDVQHGSRQNTGVKLMCTGGYAVTVSHVIPDLLFRVMVKIVVNVVDEENGGRGCLMSNDTFDNISVISWSLLLMEETGENHRPICRKSLTKFIT